MKYAIRVEEVIGRTVIVEADDLIEAIETVEAAASNGDLLLNGAEDFVERKVEPSDIFKDGIVPPDRDVSYYEHLNCSKKTHMVFASSQSCQIVFDDFIDNTKEYHSFWAEMCPHCVEKYKRVLGNRISDGACGTCSVKGCDFEAEYYVDFDKKEISFHEEN